MWDDARRGIFCASVSDAQYYTKAGEIVCFVLLRIRRHMYLFMHLISLALTSKKPHMTHMCSRIELSMSASPFPVDDNDCRH